MIVGQECPTHTNFADFGQELPTAPNRGRTCVGRTFSSGSCTVMVYNGAMATRKQVRRSVTLSGRIARQVDAIADRRRLSENRVLVELIELGIEASRQKEQAFVELIERFRGAKNSGESKRLGDELGRMVFGGSMPTLIGDSGNLLKRKISECLARLPKESDAVIDPDFAKDVEAAIDSHREPLEPHAWD